MLYGAGDPARDVEVGCDALARLADLVGVRPPALIGDDPGTTDGCAEQLGERFDGGEALFRPDAAPAAHDHRRRRQRDALCDLHPIDDARTPRIRPEHRHELGDGVSSRARCISGVARVRVQGATQDRELRAEGRVFEEAAAPTGTPDPPRRAGDRQHDVGGERLFRDRGHVGQDLVAAFGAGCDDRRG